MFRAVKIRTKLLLRLEAKLCRVIIGQLSTKQDVKSIVFMRKNLREKTCMKKVKRKKEWLLLEREEHL